METYLWRRRVPLHRPLHCRGGLGVCLIYARSIGWSLFSHSLSLAVLTLVLLPAPFLVLRRSLLLSILLFPLPPLSVLTPLREVFPCSDLLWITTAGLLSVLVSVSVVPRRRSRVAGSLRGRNGVGLRWSDRICIRCCGRIGVSAATMISRA